MENHYETLGLEVAATPEEIRRAYRVLARRYHPDLNPGAINGEEVFKNISAAHAILNDPDKKAAYDRKLEQFLTQSIHNQPQDYEKTKEKFDKIRKYTQEAQRKKAEDAKNTKNKNAKSGNAIDKSYPTDDKGLGLKRVTTFLKEKIFHSKSNKKSSVTSTEGLKKVSVVEASINIKEAVYGARKTLEVTEPEGKRKISVTIPAGVKNGSVIHLRGKGESKEELMLIIQVAKHPYISLETRGLIVEVPITVREAVEGSWILAPTLEGSTDVTVPPGCASGTEVRVEGKGVFLKDGTRGDLFVRLLVQVPTSPEAIGLQDLVKALDSYYERPVRAKLPQKLFEE